MNLKYATVTLLVIYMFLGSACSESPQETTPIQSSTATSAPVIPTSGKVVKAMHASGYTYMQVENRGKQFWVAAKMLNVKRNDYVTWTQPSLQKNFNSPTLRRTFDEILFVASATVEK